MMTMLRLSGWMAAGLVVPMMLSGCAFRAASDAAGSGTGVAAKRSITGRVYGGQQPVSNALLQLYAVGTTGSGSASTPLIASQVRSGSDGGFTLSGTYGCSGATQTYLVATGGDAGSGVNARLAMMAALGPCSTLLANPQTNIVMNELTTVAAAYALAPFMTDYTHVGAQGSNPSGLLNAFASAGALVNTANGAIAGAPAGVTLPALRVNTLANILAACINSSGSGTAGCDTLLAATGASETIGAGLAIAKNPGAAAITALYTLPSPTPPFAPTLATRPNDFTLAVTYSGAELLSPYGVAVDAAGNAWVTNEAGRSVVKAPALSAGFATTTYAVGGLLAPRGISIDRTGNVWVANTGGNNVVKLSSAGVAQGSYAAGTAPIAIANDSAGNAWVANFLANSVTELGSTGTPSGASPITNALLSAPTSLALDASGKVAVANAGNGSVCLLTNAGVVQSCPGDGALFGATAVAVSASGGVALAGSTTGSAVVGAFTLETTGAVVNAASPVSGGGLTLPTAVAYDGSGTAWFANAGSISEFVGATAVSPATGLGSLNAPAGIAIDASGNVWTANSGDNSISVFIGLATPVVTPIAMNVGP